MFKIIELPPRCKIHSVIWFLIVKGTCQLLISTDKFVSLRTIFMCNGKVWKWFRDFKNGRENVHDESRSSRLSVVSDSLVSAVDAEILEEKNLQKQNFH